MIVSGADYAFRKYTKNFILSLVNKGGIDIKRFRYFIFDFSNKRHIYDRNCRLMKDYIYKLAPAIKTTVVPFKEMREIIDRLKKFDFFTPKNLTRPQIIDYLRAYVFTYIKQPYLWIDSDIIVQKEIKTFYKKCKIKNKLSMAIEKNRLLHYFEYYHDYTGKKLHKRLKTRGTMNSGVLYIPKDYTRLWYDIYSKISFLYHLIPIGGQDVWNVIFWMGKGYFIPQRYNYSYMKKDDIEKYTLVHFNGPYKQGNYAQYMARQKLNKK